MRPLLILRHVFTENYILRADAIKYFPLIFKNVFYYAQNSVHTPRVKITGVRVTSLFSSTVSRRPFADSELDI